jgi:long-chain acyl-CoA synthetase
MHEKTVKNPPLGYTPHGARVNDLAPILEPLRRAVRDQPRRIRVHELPAGPALDGAQLLEAAAAQAAALERLGVRAGDRILLTLPNGAAFAASALGCWQAGAAVILAPGPGAPQERERLAHRFGAAAVFSVDAERGAQHLPAPRALAPGSGDPTAAPSPPAAAIIKLTSGSTGEARGVIVTGEQIAAGGRHILDTMGIEPGDTNIGFIPMTHSYGFDNLMLPLALQGSPLAIVVDPTSAALAEALCLPEACVFPGVPYLFDLLARAPHPWRPVGLRLCISAGAPLPAAVARRFRERCGLEVHNFYGATETGGICFERRPADTEAEGTVGPPLEGVRLEITPLEEPGTVELDGPSSGPCGRIVVHSSAVASGYWPEADGRPAEGGPERGRFATRDIGRLRADGRLQLLGRLDDLINVSGRKVNPAEVEEALRALPGVSEAAAFPLADPRRGEVLAACVAGAASLRRETLLEALAARLPRHKVPRHLAVLPSLPRTERGKPDRRRLQALLAPSPSVSQHET